MLGLFGGLAASVPFQKRLNEPHTEGTINRLHYSATCLIFFGCSLLVTCLGKLILIIKAKYSNLPNKRTGTNYRILSKNLDQGSVIIFNQ